MKLHLNNNQTHLTPCSSNPYKNSNNYEYITQRLSPVMTGFTLLASLPVAVVVSITNFSKTKRLLPGKPEYVAMQYLVQSPETTIQRALMGLEFFDFEKGRVWEKEEIITAEEHLNTLLHSWTEGIEFDLDRFFAIAKCIMNCKPLSLKKKLLLIILAMLWKNKEEVMTTEKDFIENRLFPIIEQGLFDPKVQLESLTIFETLSNPPFKNFIENEKIKFPVSTLLQENHIAAASAWRIVKNIFSNKHFNNSYKTFCESFLALGRAEMNHTEAQINIIFSDACSAMHAMLKFATLSTKTKEELQEVLQTHPQAGEVLKLSLLLQNLKSEVRPSGEVIWYYQEEIEKVEDDSSPVLHSVPLDRHDKPMAST